MDPWPPLTGQWSRSVGERDGTWSSSGEMQGGAGDVEGWPSSQCILWVVEIIIRPASSLCPGGMDCGQEGQW